MGNSNFSKFEYNGKITNKKMLEYVPLQLLIYLGKLAFSQVDLVVVSNLLGQQMLAAVDTYRTFYLFLYAIVVLFETGIAVVYSNTLGLNSEEKINEVKCTIFYIQILLIIVLAIVQMPLFSLYLKPIQFNEVTRGLCFDYAKSMFLALLLDSWVTIWMAQFVANGKVQMVAFISILTGILNVIFDFWFIKVRNMGVKGVGYSSVLASAVCVVIMLIYLLIKTDLLKFRSVKIGSCTKNIIKCGMPEFLNQFFMIAFRYFTTCGITICLAEAGLAAKAVCSFCYSLSFCFIQPFVMIMNQFAGMYYSSKNRKGLYLLTERLTFLSLCAATIVKLAINVFPDKIYYLFGYDVVTNNDIAAIRIFSIAICVDMTITVLIRYFCCTLQQKLVNVMNIIGRILEGAVLLITVFIIGGPSIFIIYSVPSLVNVAVSVWFYIRQKRRDRNELANASADKLYFSVSNGDVTELTSKIDEYFRQNGREKRYINYIMLAIEEYVNFVIGTNDNKKVEIDICLLLHENDIRVMFWDNGKPTDIIKLSPRNKSDFTEAEMLKAICESIKHSMVFDLNYYTFVINTQNAAMVCLE